MCKASIDYVRYLEDCVTSLKAQNSRHSNTPEDRSIGHGDMPPPPAARETYYSYDDEDHDMESDAVSPTYTPQLRSHQASVSPAMQPQSQEPHQDYSGLRNNSYSSASTSHPRSRDGRHYSYSTSASANTSPHFGPQQRQYEYAVSNSSALTSPALLPMTTVGEDRDLDQEATAALLMLNADRRGTGGSRGGRGLSVKDLLST